jgi:hypothetical protein
MGQRGSEMDDKQPRNMVYHTGDDPSILLAFDRNGELSLSHQQAQRSHEAEAFDCFLKLYL